VGEVPRLGRAVGGEVPAGEVAEHRLGVGGARHGRPEPVARVHERGPRPGSASPRSAARLIVWIRRWPDGSMPRLARRSAIAARSSGPSAARIAATASAPVLGDAELGVPAPQAGERAGAEHP
jgi:hypothetical protein